MNQDTKFTIFVVAWIAFALLLLVFDKSAGIPTKKRFLPWAISGAGVLFIGMTLWLKPQWNVGVVVVPTVLLISIFQIRLTRICDSCGKTLFPRGFVRRSICSKCGHELKT